MVGKARETYDESVSALHQWLQFLEDKALELRSQMERLRNKSREDELQDEEPQAGDKPDPWI
jgi:hypothetical protein